MLGRLKGVVAEEVGLDDMWSHACARKRGKRGYGFRGRGWSTFSPSATFSSLAHAQRGFVAHPVKASLQQAPPTKGLEAYSGQIPSGHHAVM